MSDLVAVITGASGGIGAALAERLARDGARLALGARRERELAEVAARCGPECLPVRTDVTRRGEVERLLDATLTRFGHVDVWVNNAGRAITRPVSELTDDDVDEMMRVNLKSALYGMQTVLPHFKQRGRGHIINVSSMLGRVPITPARSAYSAAKHALDALTANLREELAGEHPGIAVSIVLPGVVATEFGIRALHGGVDSRRIPGAQPADEVADVIADLIARPRPEAYTRPDARERVAGYYAAGDPAGTGREPASGPR